MNIRTFTVQLENSPTKHLIICTDGNSGEDLINELKTCKNCKIVEYPRDQVKHYRVCQDAYAQVINNENN